MSDFLESSAEGSREAEKKGLVVFQSTERLLMLDLDTVDALTFFNNSLTTFKSLFHTEYADSLIVPSKSGNHHAYVRLHSNLSIVERIAMQAFLGSDRKRDMLTLCQHFAGDPTPIILFETPASAEIVRAFLAGTEQTDKYMTNDEALLF